MRSAAGGRGGIPLALPLGVLASRSAFPTSRGAPAPASAKSGSLGALALRRTAVVGWSRRIATHESMRSGASSRRTQRPPCHLPESSAAARPSTLPIALCSTTSPRRTACRSARSCGPGSRFCVRFRRRSSFALSGRRAPRHLHGRGFPRSARRCRPRKQTRSRRLSSKSSAWATSS